MRALLSFICTLLPLFSGSPLARSSPTLLYYFPLCSLRSLAPIVAMNFIFLSVSTRPSAARQRPDGHRKNRTRLNFTWIIFKGGAFSCSSEPHRRFSGRRCPHFPRKEFLGEVLFFSFFFKFHQSIETSAATTTTRKHQGPRGSRRINLDARNEEK